MIEHISSIIPRVLEALEVAGLADVDLAAEVVALNILDFEPPDSPKVITHWKEVAHG